MQVILDWLVAFATWLLGIVITICNTVIAMFEDLFCWLFDELLHAVTYVIGLIPVTDLSAPSVVTTALAAVPASVLNAMWLMGLPQAMGMVLTAIGIRLVLQLIPFTRLGS